MAKKQSAEQIANNFLAMLQEKDQRIAQLEEEVKNLKKDGASKDVKNTNAKLREENRKLKEALRTTIKYLHSKLDGKKDQAPQDPQQA